MSFVSEPDFCSSGNFCHKLCQSFRSLRSSRRSLLLPIPTWSKFDLRFPSVAERGKVQQREESADTVNDDDDGCPVSSHVITTISRTGWETKASLAWKRVYKFCRFFFQSFLSVSPLSDWHLPHH